MGVGILSIFILSVPGELIPHCLSPAMCTSTSKSSLSMTVGQEPIRIFLVDDDEEDCAFFREAVNSSPISVILKTMCNGEDLLTELALTDNNVPDVIFLDIHMPGKNGYEVLDELRNSVLYKKVTVIMLSSSTYDKDVEDAYARGANLYIPKAVFHLAQKSILENLFSAHWRRYLSKIPREEFVLSAKRLSRYKSESDIESQALYHG